MDPSCADLSTHMEWLCSTNWPRQQKQARSQPTDCRSDGTLCPPCSRVHHSHTAGSLSRFPWSCTAAHTRRWAYCSCAIFCPLGNCQSTLSMLFFISFEFVFSGILTLLYFGRCNHYFATWQLQVAEMCFRVTVMFRTSCVLVLAGLASLACLIFWCRHRCDTTPHIPYIVALISLVHSVVCIFPSGVYDRTEPRRIPQTQSSLDTVGWTRPISPSTMTREVLGLR